VNILGSFTNTQDSFAEHIGLFCGTHRSLLQNTSVSFAQLEGGCMCVCVWASIHVFVGGVGLEEGGETYNTMQPA